MGAVTVTAHELSLPDGRLVYYPQFLDADAADRLFDALLTDVPWQQATLNMFGRRIRAPRLTAWFGDCDAVYAYSGLRNQPLPWLPILLPVRSRVERLANQDFNGLLLNLYRDGRDSVGWHSDNEPELGDNPMVASLTLGASRRFVLRHRRNRVRPISIDPEHGSLLLMRAETQRHWQHCVPKTRRTVGARINLTFRRIYPADGETR